MVNGSDILNNFRTKASRACSNVFSGAKYDLQGDIFNSPLKRLTDRILTQWYFKHYHHEDGMPFGHDIADSFTYPHTTQQNQIFSIHEVTNMIDFQVEGSIEQQIQYP